MKWGKLLFFLVLFLCIFGYSNVSAKTIGSYNIGGTTAVVDNVSSGYSVGVTGNPFAGYGDGYLYLNFSLNKVSGSSTSPVVGVRTVKVVVGSAQYVCNYGSNSSQNSTFVQSSYSAVCPVYLDSNGVSSIWVGLQDNQQNSLSQYRLTFDSVITFEQKESSQDYSGGITTINSNIGALGSYITNGTTTIAQKQAENTQAIQNLQAEEQRTQAILKDNSTTEAETGASSFFNNFQSNSHGLSGIISAPLRLIQSLSTSTCSSLVLPLPFVNNNVTLPCMSTIYSQHFSSFLTLYRLITTGLIGYWVCIRLYAQVRNLQRPQEDKVEVLNL